MSTPPLPGTFASSPYNISYPNSATVTNASATSWLYPIGSTSSITQPRQQLHVKGDAKIEGDIEVRGRNLLEVLEGIEMRLAILHPNPELEEKWERLKSLGNMYRELEREIIEKEQIWATLKK